MLSLPVALRPYFCLPAVKVGTVSIASLSGRPVRSDDLLVPRICVIPMGCTHALWWCQCLHERLAERSGCDAHRRLTDSRTAPPIVQPDAPAHLQYIDNLAVFGNNRDTVGEYLGRMQETLTQAGVPGHEMDLSEGVCELLGWVIDGVINM